MDQVMGKLFVLTQRFAILIQNISYPRSVHNDRHTH